MITFHTCVVTRLFIQRITLRRDTTSSGIECLDYLDIDDIHEDEETERRARYCGDWTDIKISTRSNRMKISLQIGELTAGMPDEIGFQLIYQTKGKHSLVIYFKYRG